MNCQSSTIKTSAMNIDKPKNNWAIITLTKGGMELGLKLLKFYPNSILFINKRFHSDDDRVYQVEDGIKKVIEDIFHRYDCLIFIMATGIVVRTIAPLLKDKTVDPAVVVLDEKGRNVISLLSGHIGRANEYTLDISNKLRSNPVITTASDVNESIAVDTIAMKLNCQIEDLKDATKITSHIVNGNRVGIISAINYNIKLPNNIKRINTKDDLLGTKGLIYINNNKFRDSNQIDSVVLRPKNLVIGLGCRRGKSKDEILRAILTALDKVNKSILSVKHIATVDIKEDEIGIIETASHLNVPMIVIDRDKIKEVEHQYETSKFVKEIIGVGAVAEPVAKLSSNNGTIILNKTKYDGVTVSIVEEGREKNGYCSSRIKP